MATSFTSVSFTPSPRSVSWCFLLLDHLDEFATLVWYLVADGKLVEDAFARTIAKLDMTAFESSTPALASSTPALAYSQARDVLITQAIGVLSDARREEDENQFVQPSSIGSLPDLPRLAFMLRFIIRSSEAEVARFLSLSLSELQGLVTYAIARLSIVPPISALTGCRDA
jgi:DNA-directed RNA polymerase specialized sigma24 family protein